jgi:hypothetical protein
MEAKDILMVIGAGVLVVAVIALLGTWAMFNGLVVAQQGVQQKGAQYAAALDVCSEKIEGVWTIYQRYLEHESQTFEKVAVARSKYREAVQSGDPQKTVDAAGGFSLAVNAVAESNPQLVSGPAVQQSINSLEISVNEIKTALDDWNKQIRDYNSLRQSVPTRFVGGMFDFPFEYSYYQGQKKSLDVSELLKK